MKGVEESRLPLEICLDLVGTRMKEKAELKKQLLASNVNRKIVTILNASTTGLLVSDRDNLNRRTAERAGIPVIDKEELLHILEEEQDYESSDLDIDSFLGVFEDFNIQGSSDSCSLSNSTEFSFTSTYSSEHYSVVSDDLEEDKNPFETIENSQSDSSDDEEMDVLKSSIGVSDNAQMNIPTYKSDAWEVGTEGEPYFPKSNQNISLTTRFYCPKSFLLKKKHLHRTKWCSLRLEFCEDFEKSKYKGFIRTRYYRVCEREYFAFSDNSDAQEYHYHCSNLETAERRLSELYEQKVDKEFYYRVSVFQTLDEKKSALLASPILTTPSNYLKDNSEDPEVLEFASTLMDFANNYINNHLTHLTVTALGSLITPTGASITLTEVMKSDIILHKLWKTLNEELPQGRSLRAPRERLQRIHQLSKDYYQCLSNQDNSTILNSLDLISEKVELSQLLKDMMQVGEEISAFSDLNETALAYRSLRCDIKIIQPHDTEYGELSSSFLNSMPKGTIINRIVSINKPSETEQLTNWISKNEKFETKLLYHGSKNEYWYSILSRGLKLPSIDPLQRLVPRTDEGKLGFGLYFSSNPEASIPYLQDSTTNSRYILCSEVALGTIYQTTHPDTCLTQPPKGFDSVQGIQSTSAMQTEFENDEYVIYNTNQHRMRYLFEFNLPNDGQTQKESIDTMFQSKKENQIDTVPPLVPDTTIKEPEPKPCGLIITQNETYIDSPCILRNVGISAKIIDFVGEVTVYQEYLSTNNDVAQAKYIFPLDEKAAVCGFEAFVNGKHIIGEVKEKEQAKQIYNEAIDKGFGAYLMTQHSDNRDLFCINIGNILNGSKVVIKITYITELELSPNNNFVFKIPKTIHQSTLGVGQSYSPSNFNLQTSITMPFDIINISSNISNYYWKKTRSKATMKSSSLNEMDEDITIIIDIEKVTEPRLYIEQDEKGHYAAMLSICPSFDWSPPEVIELLFVVDRSASMISEFHTVQWSIYQILNQLEALQKVNPNSKIIFNILGFGAGFEWLFVNSQEVNNHTLEKARKYVDQELRADLGGSDLWLALNAAYLLSPHLHGSKSFPHRSIFLLTDGNISHPTYTRNLIQEHAEFTRVFSIGIGIHQSKTSTQSLSYLGGGTCISIPTPENSYEISKIIYHQLNQSLQPSWRNIKVSWGLPGQQKETTSNNILDYFQSPAQITSLFQGDRLLIFYLGNELYTSATISAITMKKGENETMSYSFSKDASDWWKNAWEEVSHIVSTHEMAITKGDLIHKLAARSVLREWEDGSYADDEISHQIRQTELQKSIISMSIQYQLITKYTAFVAIEERFEDEILLPSIEMKELWEKEIIDELDEISWEEHLTIEEEVEEEEAAKESFEDDDGIMMFDFFGELSDDEEELDNICSTIEKLQTNIPSGILLDKESFVISDSNMPTRRVEIVQKPIVLPPKSKVIRNPKPPQQRTVHNISYGTGGGYRSGGAANDLDQLKDIHDNLLKTDKEFSFIMGDTIQTPFGLNALPVCSLPNNILKSIQNNCISHLFRGPLNSGGDCWLNSVLMLCFSMKSFRILIHQFTKSFESCSSSKQLRLLKSNNSTSTVIPSLLLSLEATIECWLKFSSIPLSEKKLSSKASKYRDGLLVAQKRLLSVFQSFGFSITDPQCAIRALSLIEEQIRLFISKSEQIKGKKIRIPWITLQCSSWDFTSPHWKSMKKKSQSQNEEYIIICNNEYSQLPWKFIMNNGFSDRISMNGYKLHSFISFHIMNETTNHFTSISLLNNGYVIYNDVLHIGSKAGGFQGAVIDCSSLQSLNSSTHPVIKQLKNSCKMVPICIFKK